MSIRITIISLLLFFNAAFSIKAQQQDYPFKNEIIAFQKIDSAKMPHKGGILFIGSSSIRKWDDLEKRFSDKPIIKRGVGGSQMSQMVDFYMPFIVYPYQPKKIFIYDGENDISGGQPANVVFENFKRFYSLIREKMPKTKIYFLSAKHSPSREKWSQQITEYNQMVEGFARDNKKVWYIDVDTIIQDANGQPRRELFLSDMLHLNSKGYDEWEKVIRPKL